MQVTEQARSSIETRMKEAEEQQRRLQDKLLESEKEKQDLEEQKRRALVSQEEQVSRVPFYYVVCIFSPSITLCFPLFFLLPVLLLAIWGLFSYVLFLFFFVS